MDSNIQNYPILIALDRAARYPQLNVINLSALSDFDMQNLAVRLMLDPSLPYIRALIHRIIELQQPEPQAVYRQNFDQIIDLIVQDKYEKIKQLLQQGMDPNLSILKYDNKTLFAIAMPKLNYQQNVSINTLLRAGAINIYLDPMDELNSSLDKIEI